MPWGVVAGLVRFAWSDKRRTTIGDDCILLNQANARAQAVDAAFEQSVVAAVWSRTVGAAVRNSDVKGPSKVRRD